MKTNKLILNFGFYLMIAVFSILIISNPFYFYPFMIIILGKLLWKLNLLEIKA